MIGRMQQPPLSSQLGNSQRLEVLQERVNRLHAQMNNAAAARVRRDFIETLERAPEDFWLRENFALFLQSVGDLAGAVAEWRHIPDLLPQDYRAAIQLNPANWELHFELGGELDSAKQLDAARNEFGEAARLNPTNARTHFNFGVLLAKQNRFDEARREFEETIRLEPTYARAREYLAQIPAMNGRTP